MCFTNNFQRKEDGFIFDLNITVIGGGDEVLNKILPQSDINSSKIYCNGSFRCQSRVLNYKKSKISLTVWQIDGDAIDIHLLQIFFTRESLFFLNLSKKDNKNSIFNYIGKIITLNNKSEIVLLLDTDIEIKENPFKKYKNIKCITSNTKFNILNLIEKNLKRRNNLYNPIMDYIKSSDGVAINVDNYLRLCSDLNLSQKDAIYSIQYFQERGFFLYVRDNIHLKRVLFKNPAEIVSVIILALKDDVLKGSAICGFDDNFLEGILHPDYRSLSDKIFELLVFFNICYRKSKDGELFIIPQVSSCVPESHVFRCGGYSIELIYVYNNRQYIPVGIIGELISKICNSVIIQSAWRDCVEVERNQTRAQIKEDVLACEIKIIVVGKEKKELLTAIEICLNDIFIFPNFVSYTKYIPCGCDACLEKPFLFEYDLLKKQCGNEIYEVQCRQSKENRDIIKMLHGIVVVKTIYNYNLNGETRLSFIGKIFDMSKKYQAKAGDGGIAVAGDGNKIQRNEQPKSASLFSKPIFYILVFVFIYSCLLLLSVADLKEKGKIADATFAEIVLSPLKLLKLVEKK